eukprot:Skav212223  [mRNA]  locus=scaffold862:168305:171910:- [translate_table: standard]
MEKRARVDPSQNPAITPKTELNSLIGKIAKKVLAKGETLYLANKILGNALKVHFTRIGTMFQATVQSAALPDEWASRAWAGESAAEQALKDEPAGAIRHYSVERANKPSSGKGQKTGSTGKKKGLPWGQMMEMMKTFMREGGPAMFREEVTADFVTGTAVEWTLP